MRAIPGDDVLFYNRIRLEWALLVVIGKGHHSAIIFVRYVLCGWAMGGQRGKCEK